MKKIFLKFIKNYLTTLAKKVLLRHKPKLVVIVGKKNNLLTKNIIHTLLVDHFNGSVRKSPDRINMPFAAQFTILGLEKEPFLISWLPFLLSAYLKSKRKEYPKYLVVDINEDAQALAELLHPEIMVFTTFVNYNPTSEKIVINGDDSDLPVKYIDSLKVAIENMKADFVAEDINYKIGDFRICATGSKISIKAQIENRDFVYPYLFAFAVGKLLNIQSLNIKKSIEKYLSK